MKHFSLKQLLVTIVLLYSTLATAQTGTLVAIRGLILGNITYDIDAIEKTATVVADTGSKYSGDIVIPATVVYYDGTVYSVTTIGDRAFGWCEGLTSITIPNSVTTIGERAFYNCEGLTSITIPNSVTTIGEKAFYGCTKLESIIVENGNSVFDSREDCNAIIETATNKLITGCKNTIIPNSVTTIGMDAFEGCNKLESITIPKSVTTIEAGAFRGCTNLTNVIIPKSVTTIGVGAFSNCTNLKSIHLISETPPTVYYFSDEQYKNVTLYIPKGTLATYQSTAVWSKFQNIKEFK